MPWDIKLRNVVEKWQILFSLPHLYGELIFDHCFTIFILKIIPLDSKDNLLLWESHLYSLSLPLNYNWSWRIHMHNDILPTVFEIETSRTLGIFPGHLCVQQVNIFLAQQINVFYLLLRLPDYKLFFFSRSFMTRCIKTERNWVRFFMY